MRTFRNLGMKSRQVNAKAFSAEQQLRSRISFGIKAGDQRVREAVDISTPYRPKRKRPTDGAPEDPPKVRHPNLHTEDDS